MSPMPGKKLKHINFKGLEFLSTSHTPLSPVTIQKSETNNMTNG